MKCCIFNFDEFENLNFSIILLGVFVNLIGLVFSFTFIGCKQFRKSTSLDKANDGQPNKNEGKAKETGS